MIKGVKFRAAFLSLVAVFLVILAAGASEGGMSMAITPSLYVVGGEVIGASQSLFTVSDDGENFSAGAQIFTGESFKLGIALGNKSNQTLIGEINIQGQGGFSFQLSPADGVTSLAPYGENSWKFVLAAGEADNTPDLIITIVTSDAIKPGNYPLKFVIQQVSY